MPAGQFSLSPLLTLLLVLLAFGLLTAAATALYMAQAILRPPRMSDGKALYLLKRLAPDDIGLPYRRVDFIVRDQRTSRPLSLAAWWIPCEASEPRSDRCAVLIHGYADAKVGAIAWASLWHALGYNLLVPDLRAHGESGGKFTTAGYFERHDLVQLINQARAEWPDRTGKLVFFGASMGAAVAVATAAAMTDVPENPGRLSANSAAGALTGGGDPPDHPRLRGDSAGEGTGGTEERHPRFSDTPAMTPGEVSAVVLESPIADMRNAISAHLDRLGMPSGLIRAAALRLAEALSGARFADVRTVDLLERLPCPVMVICPTSDVYLMPGDAEAIRSAIAARTAAGGADVFWQTDNTEHLTAIIREPAEYQRRVAEFLASVDQDSTSAIARTSAG